MPPRKERLSLICPSCGVPFQRLACQLLGRRHFCSNACIGKAKRHGSQLFCAWCDTGFYRRFGEQDKGAEHQFCSRECYDEWRQATRTSYPKHGGRHLHRIVAEAVLGRALTVDEVVHHIDHDKQNCHSSNLAVFPSQREHARCHFGKHAGKQMTDAELRFFSLEETARREQLRARHCGA